MIIVFVIIIICAMLILFLKRKEYFTNENINIENTDEKLKEILSKTNDFSINNLISSSHLWCANMRDSESMSTSCLPLKDSNDKNLMYLPVSVCCSFDYCQILSKDSKFRYKYDKKNKLYYILKNNKVVQITKGFKKEKKCIKYVNKNQKLFFPYMTMEIIKNKICSKK